MHAREQLTAELFRRVPTVCCFLCAIAHKKHTNVVAHTKEQNVALAHKAEQTGVLDDAGTAFRQELRLLPTLAVG